MTYKKVDVVAELQRAEKALEGGVRPCSVCRRGELMPLWVGPALDLIRAEMRRARQIRRVRRVGNLIVFPKL